MDVRQLEVFLAVADERNFTRAAERLHLVQSAVSSTIKSLERELGFALFSRGPRSVELTREGEGFLPSARAAVAALAEAKDVAADVRGQVRGTVNLGVLATPDFAQIPLALRAFREAYPEVVVAARTSPAGTAGLLQGLIDGSLDLSLVVLPFPIPDQIEVEPLLSGDHVFAVGRGHPLAATAESESDGPIVSTGPAILAEADLLSMPRGFAVRRALEEQLAAWDVAAEIRMELPDVGSLATCIADGLGVGILPRHLVEAEPRLRVIEIPGTAMRWTAALAVRRDRPRSAATRVLMRALLDAVGGAPDESAREPGEEAGPQGGVAPAPEDARLR